MSITEQAPPRFSADQVGEFARRLYGLVGRLDRLDSERDQNFRLTEADGTSWVVKIANAAEAAVTLDFQRAVLAHLAGRAPDLPVPRLRPALDGTTLCPVDGHFMRVVSHLPGEIFAGSVRTPELLDSLGRMLGRLDAALLSFGHPGAHYDLDWDLRHAGRSRARLHHVADAGDRALLGRFLDRWDDRIGPALMSCRAGVIHNDANDHNLLVAGGVVTGIIDFGDAIHAPLVGELAIACAYAILGQADPLAAAGRIAAAYHREMPLTDDEIGILFDLIAMRLVTSVTISASRRGRQDDSGYLTVSEADGWAMLRRLGAIDPGIATAVLRKACGLEAAAGAGRAIAWIADNRADFAPVVGRPLATMTTGIVPLGDADHPIAIASRDRDPATAQALWAEIAAGRGIDLGIGCWTEDRGIYSTPAFASVIDPALRRTLHLGLDLFFPAGTALHAPLAGRVADCYITPDPLDYGCAVLLEHEPAPGVRFWTLWGHLAHESASRATVGRRFEAGEIFAWTGADAENGNWMPHLHLQLVTARPARAADVIGAGERHLRDVWAELFPDPAALVGLHPETFRRQGRTADAIVAARRERLLPNLSISYRKPLKIVRGEGVWLIDEGGRAYLDCYNNVAHLGHAHPEVVEALAAQAAVLNTNTRYLHDTIIDYAERLTALLPAPLTVCAFACTGSEANDLALRMARAHTGRSDVITLDWAYHGHTQALIDISPYKYKRRGGAGRPDHVWEAALPDSYRAPADWPRAEHGARFAASVDEQIAAMAAKGRAPSAYIAESCPSVGGQIMLPPGYLDAAYRSVRAAGGVVIADEVQVGFGRLGCHMWGFEQQGVVPDIVTLGKPIGNGHPLSAVVTTRAIADSFANGMEYFNTFGGNAVSCAVGLKVLDIIERDGLRTNAQAVGDGLLARFRALADRHGEIGDVRGAGLFLGIELVEDRASKRPATERARAIVQKARELGVLIGTDGPDDNIIKLRPAMIFSQRNADHLMQVMESAFATA
ncbi:MAG: aminotransferase class III-fold pyridoxal phosphate-dependent enzyme [Ferrovibrionaceae bacterium]